MTVTRTFFLLICVSKCAPILTLLTSLSIRGDTSEPAATVPTGKKIVFYPIPVVMPASAVDDVIHKDPGKLQHILEEKYEKPFLPSNLPDDVAQKISEILKNPVTMELQDLDKESNFLKDTIVIEEDVLATPEPEDSFTYFTNELSNEESSTVSHEEEHFTDKLSDLQSSTVAHEVKKPNRTSKPELGRPPVKLLQRLLRDYLPVINPEVKKSTPPEKNPVISSLASKKLKPAHSMKYPVSGNGQFISLLNTLNVILNRKILPPSKTYEPFKVPSYNVSFPKFTVNVSETLLEPPHFENQATSLGSSTEGSATAGSAIEVVPPNAEATAQKETSTPAPDKVEMSSTFSQILDLETPCTDIEHEEAANINNDNNFEGQHPQTIDSLQTNEKISTLVLDSTVNLSKLSQANKATEEAFHVSTKKTKGTTTFETFSENDLSVTESTITDKLTTGDSEIAVSTTDSQPTTIYIFEDAVSTNQRPEVDYNHPATTAQLEHTQYFEGTKETTFYNTDDMGTTRIPDYHSTDFFQSATEFTFNDETSSTNFVSTANLKESTVFETSAATTNPVTTEFTFNDQPLKGGSKPASPPGDKFHTDYPTSSDFFIESVVTTETPINSAQYLTYPTKTEGESYSSILSESTPVQEGETNTEVVLPSTTDSKNRPEMTEASSHFESTQHSQDSASETSPLTNYFTTIESMVGGQSNVDWTTVISELPARPPALGATPPVPWFLAPSLDLEGTTEFMDHSIDGPGIDATTHFEYSKTREPETSSNQKPLQYSEPIVEATTLGSDQTEGDHFVTTDGVISSTQKPPQHTLMFDSEIDYEDSFTILEHPAFLSNYVDIVDGTMVFGSTQDENLQHETSSLSLDTKSTITQSYDNPTVSSVTAKPVYLEAVTDNTAYVKLTTNFEDTTDFRPISEDVVINEIPVEEALQSSTAGTQPSNPSSITTGFDATKVYSLKKHVYFVNEDTGVDMEPDADFYKHLKQEDLSSSFYDENESDSNSKKLAEVSTAVTASQTEGLALSTVPVPESKSESTQPETTQPHKTTTDSYPDTINDLIQSRILSTIETADHVTEGKTTSLFLGDETMDGVTERESTVVPPTTSRGAPQSGPAENLTISQTTELLFTDPEEKELEDPFDCRSSTVDGSTTQVTASQTGSHSKTTPKPNVIDRLSTEAQDENTIPGNPNAGTTETSHSLKTNDVTPSKIPENFSVKPRVETLGSLTTSSKVRAEKMLNRLLSEPYVAGAEELEDNNETEQDYEFDGAGMKIVKGGQLKGEWIENLTNDELKSLLEAVKLKHFRS